MITIPELRARHNKMTQAELAQKLGVNVSTVIRWERDITTISAGSLKKLSLYFDVSSDEILGIKKISQ